MYQQYGGHNFSLLLEGDLFYFATREEKDQPLYTKVKEMRRPYTPEAFTNAKRSDGVYFYVAPTTRVYPR